MIISTDIPWADWYEFVSNRSTYNDLKTHCANQVASFSLPIPRAFSRSPPSPARALSLPPLGGPLFLLEYKSNQYIIPTGACVCVLQGKRLPSRKELCPLGDKQLPGNLFPSRLTSCSVVCGAQLDAPLDGWSNRNQSHPLLAGGAVFEGSIWIPVADDDNVWVQVWRSNSNLIMFDRLDPFAGLIHPKYAKRCSVHYCTNSMHILWFLVLDWKVGRSPFPLCVAYHEIPVHFRMAPEWGTSKSRLQSYACKCIVTAHDLPYSMFPWHLLPC